MKTYELLTVVKPALEQEEADKVIEKLEELVKSYKGKTVSVEKMGKKKIAFEVAGQKEGYFTALTFELPANKVVDFKRQLTLNENIIRTMFVEASKVKA